MLADFHWARIWAHALAKNHGFTIEFVQEPVPLYTVSLKDTSAELLFVDPEVWINLEDVGRVFQLMIKSEGERSALAINNMEVNVDSSNSWKMAEFIAFLIESTTEESTVSTLLQKFHNKRPRVE